MEGSIVVIALFILVLVTLFKGCSFGASGL